MASEITTERLLELYLDTIQRCGIHLLNTEDEVVEYDIFEEFDVGVVSFLHDDSLKKLYEACLISDDVVRKSADLRKMVLEIQKTDDWNVIGVKTSQQWKKVMKLSDEIKELLNGSENEG